MYSIPERLAGLGLLVAAAATVWPAFTARTGLGLPCGLRLLTGVPCPGCGLTTAATALMDGRFGAAAAANPMIYGLAACTVLVGPLMALRAAGMLAQPTPFSAVDRRRVGWAAGLLAIASWLFQVHRLGID